MSIFACVMTWKCYCLVMATTMATQTAADFHPGDTIRTVFGRIATVLDAWGCQVHLHDGTWVHPTKCVVIKADKR